MSSRRRRLRGREDCLRGREDNLRGREDSLHGRDRGVEDSLRGRKNCQQLRRMGPENLTTGLDQTLTTGETATAGPNRKFKTGALDIRTGPNRT